MSLDTSDEITVEDEEGVVDRKVKEQVLDLRSQIDEDERAIYVEMLSDPARSFTISDANRFWGVSVRQYLRGIKRLWGNTDATRVRSVGDYWQEMHLGTETLNPPDKGGYQFSLAAHLDTHPPDELKRAIGLPKRAELPKPEVVEFHGLDSILSQNRIEHTWVVKTDVSGPPPEHESVHLQVAEPIPKHILENAVEAADNFLQQAGLGFDVGVPDYHGGDTPGL